MSPLSPSAKLTEVAAIYSAAADTLLDHKFSVLICSKNGGLKLERLLAQLALHSEQIDEIILVDDGSDPPLSINKFEGYFIQNAKSEGLISSRNHLASKASNEAMLFLDDDVVIHDFSVFTKGVELLLSSTTVGAVAFCQEGLDGQRLPLQPIYSKHPSQIPTYFGWAHLIRRSSWEQVGPFCELFKYGYEESEFSIRLLNSGYKVMGGASLRVIHDAAASHKNREQRRRLNLRNMMLTATMHYPASEATRRLRSILKGAYASDKSPIRRALANVRLILSFLVVLPLAVRRRSPLPSEVIKQFHSLLKIQEEDRKLL